MESVKTCVFKFVHYKRRALHNLIRQYPAHIKHLCKRKKQYWRQRETLGVMA